MIPESALIAGCGYVGRRVAERWLQRGMQVYAITRSADKARELIAYGIVPVIADLSQSSFPPLPDPDVLLWSVGFERSSDSSRESVWIDGLRRLLDALPEKTHEQGRRILYTSSTSVYGDGAGQNVDENTSVNPITEGGVACLAAEQLLQEYGTRKNAIVSILRLAGIYGPDRLLRRIEDLRNSVPIDSPPDDWLNLIHVDDVVTAIDVVSRMESPPALMNVVTEQSVTRRQYYSTLATLAKTPLPIFQDLRKIAVDNAAHPQTAAYRTRGGNRRVKSLVRQPSAMEFRFDSIEDGLKDSLDRSEKVRRSYSR